MRKRLFIRSIVVVLTMISLVFCSFGETKANTNQYETRAEQNNSPIVNPEISYQIAVSLKGASIPANDNSESLFSCVGNWCNDDGLIALIIKEDSTC